MKYNFKRFDITHRGFFITVRLTGIYFSTQAVKELDLSPEERITIEYDQKNKAIHISWGASGTLLLKREKPGLKSLSTNCRLSKVMPTGRYWHFENQIFIKK